ncbi:MAG: FtsX-like permease family protein [Bacteroidia bacterium]|nr:FtsX-like permease family protein [Bacteroidia bacterium]
MNFEYFYARRITFHPQRKASTLVVRLSVLSMALAVATMEIALSFVQGFETEIQKKVLGFASHLLVTPYYTDLDNEATPLDRGVAKRVQLAEGVVSVSPYVERWGVIKSAGGWEGALLKGVDSLYNWDYFRSVLRAGELPRPGEDDSTGVSEILISKKLAARLQLGVGDRARLIFMGNTLRRRPIRVSGIYETGMEEFDNTYVLCSLGVLQDIWGWDASQVSGLEVRIASLEEQCGWRMEERTLQIGGLSVPLSLPAYRCEPPLALAASRINEVTPPDVEAVAITDIYPEIFDWLRLQHQNVWVILVLMIIVAVINMTTVVLILIIERARTVGILKSMGMPARRIQRLFIWHAFFLILIGVIAGNLLGLGLLASQDHWNWLRVNQEDYFIETVPVAWVWLRFAGINAAVVAVWTLFMLVPSILVYRISPLRAIRFE